jgi:hypothetical protein|tara:strand:- start:695 stop:1129 length:435 start_codon:yes stop_codon:yes gene_type:complete
MTKISNRDARQYVQKRKEFTGSNTFGRWVNDDNYVVFSYGEHFPMFAYKKNFGWCTQTSKYSVTTSKHYTQLHPLPDPDIVVVAGVPELQDFTRASVEQLLIKYIQKRDGSWETSIWWDEESRSGRAPKRVRKELMRKVFELKL